jgi:hypothetical protein
MARKKRSKPSWWGKLPVVTLEELGLSELNIDVTKLPLLTLREYLSLISDIPLPTQQQKENFVEYVSHAHSWYKHLPMDQPGAPFYFFIDKYAGYDRFLQKDGTAFLEARVNEGFHYSALPTAEYLEYFGHLAYSCGFGKAVVLLSDGPVAVPRDDIPAVPGDDASMYRLPTEIAEAGLTQLTGVIHSLTAQSYDLEYRLIKEDGSGAIDWPEESGGQDTITKIILRCDVIQQTNPKWTHVELKAAPGRIFSVDPELYEILTPERLRQSGEMIKAMDRVCAVIGNARNN